MKWFVLKKPRRSLRMALHYWFPHKLTLTHNSDGTPRQAIYAWLWWNI
jgi:hypothetical protein